MMYNLHTRVHSSETHTHIRKWAHISVSFARSFFPFDIYCHSNRSTFTRHQSYVVHLKFDLQTNMLENMLSIIFVSALWWLLLLLLLVLLLLFFCVKKVSSTSNTMCQIDAIWIMRRNAIMVIQPSFFVCVRVCVRYLFIGQLLCNERTVPMSCPIFEQTKNKQGTFAHHFNQFSP